MSLNLFLLTTTILSSKGGGVVLPASVSNKVLNYGIETPAQEGAFTVIPDSGTISSITIDSGNTGTVYETSGATIRTAATKTATSLALGCTATFSDASTDTFTATITAIADEFTVATDAEYVTTVPLVLTHAASQITSIGMRNANFDWVNSNLDNRAFANVVTIHSSEGNRGAQFNGSDSVINTLRVPKNLTFSDIRLFVPWTNGVSPDTFGTGRGAIGILGNIDNFIVTDCELHSNLKQHILDEGYIEDHVTRRGAFGWKGFFGTDGTSEVIGTFEITENLVHGLWFGIVIPKNPTSGTGLVEGNILFDIGGDWVHHLGPSSDNTIRWNTGHSPLFGTVYKPESHVDFYQHVGNGGLADITNNWVYGNELVFVRDVGDTIPGTDEFTQFIFMEDINNDNSDNFHYVNGIIGGNTCFAKGNHGVSFFNAKNYETVGNCVVSPQDAAFNDRMFILLGAHFPATATADNVKMTDNIAHTVTEDPNFGGGNATNITISNNSEVVPTSYGPLFDGISSDFEPTNLDEMATMFTIKSGGAADTASPKRGTYGTGYVDYDNRIFDHPSLAPTVSSSVPADDATDVALNVDPTVTFSRNISFGTGNITLFDVTNTTNEEVFEIATDVGSGPGKISISGAVLTIEPTSDLTAGIEYAIKIDATAIDELITDSSFVGITDNTTISFTAISAVNNINWDGDVAIERASLTGSGTSTKFLAYFQIEPDSVADTEFLMDHRDGGIESFIQKQSAFLRINLDNSAGTQIHAKGVSTLTTGINNVIIAVDTSLATAADRLKVRVNDTDVTGWNTITQNEVMDWFGGTFSVSGTTGSSANRYTGNSKAWYFAVDQYLDPDVAANRRVFHAAGTGDPTDLSTAPAKEVEFIGNASATSAGTNTGTGGAFTKVGTGSITDV